MNSRSSHSCHGPEEARRVGEMIRRNVSTVPVVYRGTPLHLSVSIGIAFWQAGEPLTVALKTADAAAYAAKQAGRDTWRLAA